MLQWFKANYLQASPDKFQLIMFNSKSNDYVLSISDQIKLQPQREVTLLGINIDFKLSFSLYIDELCKKAGRKINVLSRLSKVLNQEAKYQLFQTFVISHFNFCPFVWHYCSMNNLKNFCPIVWHYCSMNDLKKVENVQKRALRMVYGDFECNYKTLLSKCKRPLM